MKLRSIPYAVLGAFFGIASYIHRPDLSVVDTILVVSSLGCICHVFAVSLDSREDSRDGSEEEPK